MSFYPDITKQAIEVIFSVQTNQLIHPGREFTNHLGLYLDERLSFA